MSPPTQVPRSTLGMTGEGCACGAATVMKEMIRFGKQEEYLPLDSRGRSRLFVTLLGQAGTARILTEVMEETLAALKIGENDKSTPQTGSPAPEREG